jgi:riboflavin synthase
VRLPEEIERYVAMKGSIAIDGISLTVAALHDGVAEIAVIPFTYAQTNLRGMRAGDTVNIECDILAKYVERMLDARANPASARQTIERLVKEGF